MFNLPDDAHPDAEHGDEVTTTTKGTISIDDDGKRSYDVTHVNDGDPKQEDFDKKWKEISDGGFKASGGILGKKGISVGGAGNKTDSGNGAGEIAGGPDISGQKLLNAIKKYNG